jgi:Predicted membrane protein
MTESDHHSSGVTGTSVTTLSRIVLPAILIVAVIVVLYMAKDSTYSAPVSDHRAVIETVVDYAKLGCEAASVIVIVTSAIHGLISYIKRLFSRDFLDQIRSSESIRLRMGHRLSLALEFAMASDILSLTISPRFNELLSLFIIILLRVLITIFLEYDIEVSEHFRMVPVKDGVIMHPDCNPQKEDKE